MPGQTRRSDDNLKLPKNFKVGQAIADGNCFFDSFRQGLEQQLKVTVKQLRIDCQDFAQNKPPEWFINAIANSHDNNGDVREETPDSYTENILQSNRWGDPEVEGRILCEKYGVELHVIEKYNNVDGEEVRTDQIIDSEGSKSVNSINYNKENTIHIVNRGFAHFEPVLSIQKIEHHEQRSSDFSDYDDELTPEEKLIYTIKSSIDSKEETPLDSKPQQHKKPLNKQFEYKAGQQPSGHSVSITARQQEQSQYRNKNTNVDSQNQLRKERTHGLHEKMSQKAFAVVQFLNNQTFSEVPTNWIKPINRDEKNNYHICWWPNTKNISSLIKNRTEPNIKTWSMFDITVIKYYSKLASARKLAENSNTTDEEEFGRGQSINRPTSNPMPIYDPEKAENSRQSVNTCTTKKNLHFSTSTKNSETETLASCSNINKCSSNEIILKKTVHPDKSSSPVTLDLDNIPILEIPSVKEVYNILERIEKNLDKITQENVKINFELTNISKRLATLESCRYNNTEPAENDMIISLLPIKTVESMKEFDDLIKSNEAAASQFKKFISKIGGDTSQINIHHALEQTISDICTINCSWEDVRSKNYKICNLTFINIIRDIVCSIHSGLTEAEFDVTSAEWLKFAKQRAVLQEQKKIIL